MKKNAMLKIAAILMVAVLLTTCAISSTFAKYVTAPTASTNTARVAKWGVQLTATAANAFSKTYENGAAGVTVSSQTDMNVMAPGTKADSAVSITIAGEPEVDAQVDVKTTNFVVLSDNWTITENGSPVDYCPIKFKVTVNGGTTLEFYVGGLDHSTADDDEDTIADANALETAINTYITTHFVDAKYEAEGASGSTRTPIAMSLTIGWEWVFAGETTTGAYRTDARDTLLGNTVSGDTAPTITFNAEVAVTQID